jgi:hypothetical protein
MSNFIFLSSDSILGDNSQWTAEAEEEFDIFFSEDEQQSDE